MTFFLMEQPADRVLWLLQHLMHLLKVLLHCSNVCPMSAHSEHIYVRDLQCWVG